MTQKQFQLITYFLFQKLDEVECKRKFRGCYPARDQTQESEFRKITFKLIVEMVENVREIIK